MQAIDEELNENLLPIFIGLKAWNDANIPLIEFIVQEFDICGFPDALPFVEHILTKGKCLLLLDGFDEVTREEDTALQEITDFTNKYNKNHFILSCRVAAWKYTLEHFTDVEVADFNDDQIHTFIQKWFMEDSKTAKECWEKLRKNESIKEIANIPLLLTMLCIAYDELLDFPPNYSSLYREAVDALIKKWDTTRRIKRQEVYKSLTPDRKISLLSHIAAKTYEQNQYFLPQNVLENYIGEYLKNFLETNEASLRVDSEAVLKAIEAHHGLLVERAKHIYSFSHKSFQEYFTAKYLEENQGKGTIQELVDQYFLNDAWREVFILTAGLLADAEYYLKEMRGKIQFRKKTNISKDRNGWSIA